MSRGTRIGGFAGLWLTARYRVCSADGAVGGAAAAAAAGGGATEEGRASVFDGRATAEVSDGAMRPTRRQLAHLS